MRAILQKRALRYVFGANVVSMLGSGMNSAAVAWFILQATHSEMALGTLAVLQTIPAMLMLPFTGVIIDREDRRRLVMMLDAARAIVILVGAILGFVYEHIGLGGVLLIDFSTYVISFLCYFAVRKGRHVVPRPAELRADIIAAETQIERFGREMKEGIHFLRDNRAVAFLGACWALFLGAMLTGIVVTPSLSERVFRAGATGYGWLNGGWGVGAFLSALYAPQVIAGLGSRRSVAIR